MPIRHKPNSKLAVKTKNSSRLAFLLCTIIIIVYNFTALSLNE